MDEFSELEAELKQLRPAAISEEFVTRMEREMTREREPGRRTAGTIPRGRPALGRWWFPLGGGLAAALVVFLLARPTPSSIRAPRAEPVLATATASGLVPTGLTQVVYNSRDEGVLFAGDNMPFRRTRYQTRETVEWKDETAGASLRVSYPSEGTIYRRVFGE